MSKVIRISDDLYDSAKEIAMKESRPMSWQINIWAESGKNEKESFYKRLTEIETQILKNHGFPEDKIAEIISTIREGNDNE